MDLIKRADLPQVELRNERVTVESLGGDVLVRGRMLADTLRLAQLAVALPLEGETDDAARARAGADRATAMLACQVLDADEQPLMGAKQWAIWGGSHPGEFQRLYVACERVAGGKKDIVEKN